MKYISTFFILFSISFVNYGYGYDDNTQVNLMENNKTINYPKQLSNKIEDKIYLFDVSDHSIEELKALLIRAEEISEKNKKDFEKFKIIMVLHGRDINWFTHQNYETNRELINMAAELDKKNIIDMKACKITMRILRIKSNEIPEFIETVPYGPAEINKVKHEGAINL